MAEQDEAPDRANYIDVRAKGVSVGRGVRHWVRREPGQTIQECPAVCGATARRGWVAMPSRTAHDCDICLRRLDDPQAGGGESSQSRSRTMPGHKRAAFYVDETMKTDQGYIPSVVTEGEPGYAPLAGNGKFSSPWYWGHDIETAKKIAAQANAELGLTEADVSEIVLSSMAASRGRTR